MSVTYGGYEVRDKTSKGYKVLAHGVKGVGATVARVQFPTWTTANGQDDLVANWSSNSAVSGTKIGATNAWVGTFTIYNNLGVPASLTTLAETYLGQPVYRLSETPDAGSLESFKKDLWSHGVYGNGMTFKANTKYVVSIYWRPQTNTNTMQVGLTASNVGGWYDIETIPVGNGWYRSSAKRDGSVTSDKSDANFFSFRCIDAVAGTPIVVDWSCPQITEGFDYPIAYYVDGDTYSFTVNASEHNSEAGEYNTHVYGVDSLSNVVMLFGFTVNVPKFSKNISEEVSYNRCPDFSKWTLIGGATVNANGELTLPSSSARAVSPYIPLSFEPYWYFSADYYSDSASLYPAYAPNAGYLQGSSYYDDNFVNVANSAGYTGNGDARSYPKSTWSRVSYSYVGNTTVAYIRFEIVNDYNGTTGAYSSPSYSVRRPMLVTTNDQNYVPYGITYRDSIAIKESPVVGDTSTVTDSIQKLVGDALGNDSITLTDSISSKMYYYGFGVSKFGTGRFGDSTIKPDTKNDTATVSDSVSRKTTKPTTETAITMSDTLKSSVSILKTEALTLLDSTRYSFSKLLSDSVTVSDSLLDVRLIIPVLVADTIALTDSVYKLMNVLSSDSVSLTDNILKAVTLQLADSASLSDEVLRTFSPDDFQESLSIIDSFTKSIAVYKTEALSVADTLSAYYQKPLSDAVSLVEGVAKLISLDKDESVLTLVDSFLKDVHSDADDSVSSSDDIELDIMLDKDESVAVADALIKTIKPLVSDVLSVSDSLNRLDMQDVNADSTPLSETFSIMLKRTVNDTVGLIDSLTIDSMFALPFREFGSAQFGNMTFGSSRDGTDTVGLSDDVEAYLLKSAVINDLVSLSDGLTKLIRQFSSDSASLSDSMFFMDTTDKTTSDSLGSVLDSIAFGMSKAISSSVLMTDSAVSSVAKVLSNETVTLNDAVLKQFNRDLQSAVSVLDVVCMNVRAVMSSIVSLSDSARFDIQASRQEVLNIMDALGLSFNRDKFQDMVGVLDESIIRAILGSKNDFISLGDQLIECRRFTILNQVFINGISVPVVGLKVHHATNERVSSCTFSVPDPSQEMLNLFQLRAEVTVYLSDGDGVTDFFGGYVVDNPVSSQTTMTTNLEVTLHDYTEGAYNRRVTEVFENNPKVTDIVKALWNKYAPFPIDLSGIEDLEYTVPFESFKYTTLFDATEELATLLECVWYVDWQGGNKVLRFFQRDSQVATKTFSRANCNVVAGTAKFGQSNNIVNMLYIFGGNTLSNDYTHTFVANGNDLIYTIPHSPYPPEGHTMVVVKHDGVEKIVDFDYPYWIDGKDVLVNVKGRFVRYNSTTKPQAGVTVSVVYKYEYPLAVILDDSESIRRFGLMEEVISDSNIQDPSQAIMYGNQILRDSSYPKGYGSLETTETGLRAGMIVGVYMPHLNAVGDYQIVEIEKSVEGTLVRQSVTLNISDTPESGIAQKLKDFASRLEDLELRDVADESVIQRIARNKEVLSISDAVTFQQNIADSAGADLVLVSDKIDAWLLDQFGNRKFVKGVADTLTLSDIDSKHSVTKTITDTVPISGVARFQTDPTSQFTEGIFGTTKLSKEVKD